MTKRHALLILGGLLILGIALWFSLIYTADTIRVQPLTPDLEHPVTPTPQPSTSPSTSAVFTSEKLGVRFNYLSYSQDFNESFSAQEKGNEITISFDSRPEGQSRTRFITVLQKSAAESLEQTVKQIAFSNNIVPKECLLATPQFIKLKPGYQALSIVSAPTEGALENECTSTYGSDWRSAYFLYNRAIPTKVLFIDNGQDPFPAGPEIDGQTQSAAETIEIF